MLVPEYNFIKRTMDRNSQYYKLNKVYQQNTKLTFQRIQNLGNKKDINQMLSIRGQNIIKITNRTAESTVKIARSSQHTINKPPLPKSKSRNIKILKHDYVCDQRKQNNLQCRFVRKKQKLLQITKQNVKIFQRINSQKSMYSHRSLNKSYQSNKSLMNSRSSKKSLKKSQISNRSNQSNKSNSSIKNTFFNRPISAKNIHKNLTKKIVIRDLKRKSMVNLNTKNIQHTKPQQIQQFTQLFNIKQQPTLKQRNKINRIKSTKTIRPTSYAGHKNKFLPQKSYFINKSRHILINEQNQIEIHQQLEAQQQSDTFRNKKSDTFINKKSSIKKKSSQISVHQRSSRNIAEQKIGQAKQEHKYNAQIKSQLILKQNDLTWQQKNNLLTVTNIMTQNYLQDLKSSKKSILESSRNINNRQQRKQNIQNLFEIKNTGVRSRLDRKMTKQNNLNINLKSTKINFKYQNLLSKINEELQKGKKPKQSSIYQYKSRLIS